MNVLIMKRAHIYDTCPHRFILNEEVRESLTGLGAQQPEYSNRRHPLVPRAK